MSYRDLTYKFQDFRGQNHQDNTETKLIIENQEENTKPIWSNAVDKIRENLSYCKESIEKIKIVQTRLSLPSFQDMKNEQERLNKSIDIITKTLKNCTRSTISLTSFSNLSDVDVTILKRIQQNILGEIRNLTSELKTQQERYKNQIEKDNITRDNLTDFYRDPRSSQAVSFQNESFNSGIPFLLERVDTQERRDYIELNETMISQRETEIQKLARSIVELSEMFQDLNALIIEQGTVLDRIDYNVTMAAESTQKAVVELEKAKKLQSTCCRKILYILISVIVVIIISIAIYLTVKFSTGI